MQAPWDACTDLCAIEQDDVPIRQQGGVAHDAGDAHLLSDPASTKAVGGWCRARTEGDLDPVGLMPGDQVHVIVGCLIRPAKDDHLNLHAARYPQIGAVCIEFVHKPDST